MSWGLETGADWDTDDGGGDGVTVGCVVLEDCGALPFLWVALSIATLATVLGSVPAGTATMVELLPALLGSLMVMIRTPILFGIPDAAVRSSSAGRFRPRPSGETPFAVD